MEHKISGPGPLLGGDGRLREPGWSDRLLLDYDRKAIRAPAWRIKEWDYYCVLSEDWGLALTIADNSYMGLVTATVLDFAVPTETSDTVMMAFPMGRLGLPANSASGVTEAKSGGASMRFESSGGQRRLTFSWPSFGSKAAPKPPRASCCAPLTSEDLAAARAASPRGDAPIQVGLEGEIVLKETPGGASMVIATPFAKPKSAFYYNQKINCQSAEGSFRFGSRAFELKPKRDFAVLDWGRGVWPWSNGWCWGWVIFLSSLAAVGLANRPNSAPEVTRDANGKAVRSAGSAEGRPFGFNIGYGFGDTRAASENMVFYDGVAHKIGRLRIELDERDFMKSWRAVSDDGRFDMTLTPRFDRNASTDVGIIAMIPHQVFGSWTGYAVLDDGSRVEVEGLRGFCEKVRNRW